MEGICPGLAGARAIVVPPHVKVRVCSSERYAIRYREFGAGPLRSCLVSEVQRVASAEQAEALVEERQNRAGSDNSP
jgi:hypothetical protein